MGARVIRWNQRRSKAKVRRRLRREPASQVIHLVARCDLCSSVAEGTKEELMKKGWEFGPGYQFCPKPKHN